MLFDSCAFLFFILFSLYLKWSLSFSAPTNVLREMCKRSAEYLLPMKIRVSVGTYNVNGGKHFRSVVYKELSLSDWLLDMSKPQNKSSKFFFKTV